MDRSLSPFDAIEGCTTDEFPVFMLQELEKGGLDPDAEALLAAYESLNGSLPKPTDRERSSGFSPSNQLKELLLGGFIKPEEAKKMMTKVRKAKLRYEFGEGELHGELSPFAEKILAELDRGEIDFSEAAELIRQHNAQKATSLLENLPAQSAIVCIGRQAHRRLVNVNIGKDGSIIMTQQNVEKRRRGF